MPINKNAFIRYRAVDKLLRNSDLRRITLPDILIAVNAELDEVFPGSEGIGIRQLQNDIQFMRKKEGFNAPIEHFREGYNHYYRYKDVGFTINQGDLTQDEADKMKQALEVLQRFEGRPEFAWIQETYTILRDRFQLSGNTGQIVSYESNIDYKGQKWITHLYNSVVSKQVLEVKYKPFNKPQSIFEFHPHHLKQFNNRWFVFGFSYDENQKLAISNVALDRIVSLKKNDESYHDETIDWYDYFYDIIGVTNVGERQVEDVTLIFSKARAGYIETKPIHFTQKEKRLEDGRLEVRIRVKYNLELMALLLSFGDDVEILSPERLKLELKEKLKMAWEKYD